MGTTKAKCGQDASALPYLKHALGELTAHFADAVLLLNAEGLILLANPAASVIFGYPSGELLGQSVELLVPDANRAKHLQMRKDYHAHPQPRSMGNKLELFARRRDGSVVPVNIILSPLAAKDGTYVIAVVADTTEHKQLHDKLKQSEAYLRRIFDGAGVGMSLLDSNGRILEANPTLLDFLGYEAGEFRRTTFTEYTYREDKDHDQALFRTLMDGQRSRYVEEKRCIRKDGQLVWGRETVTLLPTRDDQPRLALSMLEDITASKEAEEQLIGLSSALDHCTDALDHCADAIFICDSEGIINYVNPSFVQRTGYTREEVIGRTPHFLRPDGGDLDSYEAMWKAVRSGEIFQAVFLNQRKDGTQYHDDRVISALRNKSGEIVGSVSCGRDISDLIEKEDALHALSGQLLRLQDEERRRIARELHDSSGQTLAALGMKLSALQQDLDSIDASARDTLSECLSLASQCSQELRTLSSLLHPPQLDDVGLHSALQWYIERFVRQSNISVDLDIPKDLPPLPQVMATTLYRTVQESLMNIYRHSGSPSARIRIAQEMESIILRVQDQGRGIPAEEMRIIRGTFKTLGLGIPGMQERIRQLGGELNITSSEKGTTVEATIPFQEARI